MDLFYNLIKNSDNNQLDLINKEIYKMNKGNKDYWKFLIQNTKLEDKVILDNITNIDVNFLVKRQKLSNEVLQDETFLKIVKDRKIYNIIIIDQILDEKMLDFYLETFDNICWDNICKYQSLNIDFMERNVEKLSWDFISEHQFMTLEFIVKHKDNINWKLMSENVKLEFLFNDSFLEIFSDYGISDILIWSKNISDTYLIDNLYKLDQKKLIELLEYRSLNEEILQKIVSKYDEVDIFSSIAKYQNLSIDFINEHFQKFNLNDIIENQKISIDFIKSNIKNINLRKISYNDNLDEDLLIDIYDADGILEEELDWDYISEFSELSDKAIKKITHLNKELLLDNININLN